jgi:predicted O-methyltransferase YrrM
MMDGLVARSVKKFVREVNSFDDAVTFCRRILLPVDPRVRQTHSWIWGKLPRLELRAVLPGVEAVSISIMDPCDRKHGMTLDVEELATLVAAVKFWGAKNILEIGTFDGSTALNLAANTPADAHIVTIDLPPDTGPLSIDVPKDYQFITGGDVVGRRFKQNTEYQKKITQVWADSASLDWSSLPGGFDIIFIDGCHHYDYVLSDTENALSILNPNGLVIWHDYGYFKGVSDVVDETSRTMKVRAIAGTRIAIGFAGVQS